MIIDSWVGLKQRYWGYHKTGERALTLAGHQGRCVELTGMPLRAGQLQWGESSIGIICQFSNKITADFDGTPNAVADFYQMLKTAKRTHEQPNGT